MDKKPLVTIVTITFNLKKNGREETFRQCLESVHNQTYKNIEHIVIDGASTDGTIDLIKEYADKGWVKYISEPDTGIYNAMNKGIKMAKGKYIAFLNSDDFYHGKEGVAKTVEALEESQADFSYAPTIMLDEDGKNDEKHPHCRPNIKNVFYVMPFCHQTMFTRRDILLKENLFDDSFKSAGDYDLVIRLCLKRYKSVFVKDVFTTYRWGGFSIALNDISIKEVSKTYFKNYSKLTKISKDDCNRIYCTSYINIPLDLAVKLEKCNDYFDYNRYLTENKNFKKANNKSRYLLEVLLFKFIFAIFSPYKFFKKYFNILLNSKLRQPARKVWYFIRNKKIKE